VPVFFFVQVASAEFQLGGGRYGAVALGIDAVAEYDSNITRSSAEEEDTILIALPKLLYRYDASEVLIDAYAGLQFRRYMQFTEYNAENIKSGLTIEYPNGDVGESNFDLRLDLGYNETRSADPYLQAVVERNTYHTNISGSYYFNDRYFMRSGLYYKQQDTVTAGFNDITTLRLPIDFLYRYSDYLSLGLGYQVRDTAVEDVTPPAADSMDHAVYAVANGQLTPTLDLKLRVGGQQRQFDSNAFEDQDALYAMLELGWDVTDFGRLAAEVGNEFDTSSENVSVETAYAQLSYRHRFNYKLSSLATIRFQQNEFTRLAGDQYRSDDEWIASLEAEYSLIEDRLILDGLIYYSDQDSNIPTASYARTMILLSLSFIY